MNEVSINCDCPCCGSHNDTATGPTNPDRLPATGDITLCLHCAFIGVFVREGDKITVRLPTDTEEQSLKRRPEVAFAQAMVKKELESKHG